MFRSINGGLNSTNVAKIQSIFNSANHISELSHIKWAPTSVQHKPFPPHWPGYGVVYKCIRLMQDLGWHALALFSLTVEKWFGSRDQNTTLSCLDAVMIVCNWFIAGFWRMRLENAFLSVVWHQWKRLMLLYKGFNWICLSCSWCFMVLVY
jgi:hypothetical protein